MSAYNKYREGDYSMTTQILFIQGAGEGAHAIDATLAENLRGALGSAYQVAYPTMPNEADPQYPSWKSRIEMLLADMQGPITLVAHSVGGSILLKCLSELNVEKPIAGIFLMAAPFWGGDGWHYEGYEQVALPKDIEAKLPHTARVFFYHCRDDATVPFEHLALYEKLLQRATVRKLDSGGHQLSGDLSLLARDIERLTSM